MPENITYRNIIVPGIRCAPDHGPASAFQAYMSTTSRLTTAREQLEQHLFALKNPWSYVLQPAEVVEKNAQVVKDAEKCVSVQGRLVEDVHVRILVMQRWKWGFWLNGRSLGTRASEVVWELWNLFWDVLDLLTALAGLCKKARKFYGTKVLGVREGRRLRVDIEAVEREKAEIVFAWAEAITEEKEEERRAMEEMEKEEREVEKADGEEDSGHESSDNLKRRRSETVDYDAEGETDEEAHDDKRARI